MDPPCRLCNRHNPGFSDMVLADNLLGDGRRCLLVVNQTENGSRVLCAPLPADAASPWADPMVLADGLMDENAECGISAPSAGLAVGDLDGDGHLEFVCGNYWFKREGQRLCAVPLLHRQGLLPHRPGRCGRQGRSGDRGVQRSHLRIQLSGATLSVFRQGVDITQPWEEQVLSDSINDCGVLLVGSYRQSPARYHRGRNRSGRSDQRPLHLQKPPRTWAASSSAPIRPAISARVTRP